MKLLFENKRYILSVVLTILMVFGTLMSGYADITPVADRTPQIRDAIVAAVPGVNTANDVTAAHLAAITSLNLRNAGITALKKGDFSDMTGLTTLNLFNNALSSLPDGIFEGLTSLTTIRLGRNSVDPFPLTVSLEKVGTDQFKAVAPAGATFDIVLPVTVTNGSISGGATTLTVSQGSVESGLLTVTRTSGTTAAVTADIGTLPSLPRNHYGYALTKSDALPITIISGSNTAPVFTDGTSVTRSVAESTAAATNIGTPIAATDAENDTLTYTLSGTDASAFDIDSTTGQLKTKAALDYETKTSYTVTLTVSDGSLTDTITVTINVTDVDEVAPVDPPITPDPPTTNSAPVFTEGDSTTRVIAENTPAGVDIGNAVLATDTDNDSLAYTLGGVDANTFDLDSSGQLKTKAPLDYETKRVYLVTITADDGELSSTITVIISVIDVNDTVLSAGFVPVADRTADVRDAIVAAVPNVAAAADVTESQVAAITNLNLRNKGIASLKTGDFSGMTSLSNLNLFGNQLSSLPTGTFNGLTALSVLRLGSNAVDPLPLIVSLQQTSDNTFKAVITTGAPFNIDLPLTVTGGSISGGTTSVTIPQGAMESTSFTVIGTSAEVSFGTLPGLPRNHFGYELAQTTVCNRTTQVVAAIAKAVGVSDCRAVTEVNLATITTLDLSGQSIASLSAGDFDGMLSLRSLSLSNNDLTSLPSGIFDDLVSLKDLFLNSNKLTTVPGGIFSNLTSLTNLYLQSNDLSYLPSDAFDGLSALSSINLQSNDLTSLPGDVFDGTPNLTSILLSNNKMTSMPNGIFEGLTQLNQLHLSGNPNPSSQLSLQVSLQKVGTNQVKAVAPSGAPFAIAVPIIIKNGTLAGGATVLSIPIGTVESLPITVTRTAGTFNAVTADIGTLPNPPSLHNGYALAKAAGGPLEVLPQVNAPPVFTEGATTTRTVAENTASGTNIGNPVAATDADNDTLNYSLSGTDANSFSIVPETGQLQTFAALDYETQTTYTVTITVSDGNHGDDMITVTINVTDVSDYAPVFTDGTNTTRSVAENTALGTNVGTPVAATDAENDTLTYTISGTDAASFIVDDETGQIRTSAVIDYEVKNSYTVTVNVTDSTNNSDSITVTINVTDETETPISPALNLRTPVVRAAIVDEALGVSNVADVTVAHLAAITKLNLNAKSLTLVQSTDFNGLTGLTSIDLGSNSLTSVSALSGLTQLTSLRLNNNSLTDISALSGLTQLTELDLSSNSLSNISALSGMTNLTYLNLSSNSIIDISALSGMTSMDTIDLRNTSITNVAAMSSMTSLSYVYIAGTSISDYAPLRTLKTANPNLVIDININNNPPAFTDGTSTTRSVAENTKSGENIGSAVAATDADNDTLTYTLGGTDAASFSIHSTTGQLQTKAALDYETKSSYSVTITASDGNGGTDSINVVISVTDVDETSTNNEPVSNADNSAPVFAEGNSTTRSVAENTGSGVDIGTAVSATDPDNDTLTYSLGGTDAASFSINSTNGQLRTNAALDYETQTSYAVTLTVSDSNGGSDTITVTINVTDVNENLISPSISSRTPQVRNAIVSAAGVQSADDVTVTHLKAILSLNLNEQSIRSLKAGDFNGLTALKTLNLSNNSISDISTLSGLTQLTHLDLSRNSMLSGMTAITTLSLDYNLIFDISALSGMTKMISLNLRSNNVGDISALSGMTLMETLDLWSNKITDVSALSGMSLLFHLTLAWNPISDFAPLRTLKAANPSLSIDINLNNNSPVFTEGSSTTRSIPERTASGTNIGNPVAATDADNHTLNYSLSGTDANSFSIIPDTGQLQTFAALDYETQTTYTVTITVSDGNHGDDMITVTINVTDVSDYAPVFTDGTNTTRSVAENTALGTNVGTPVAATDAENDTLTYTISGTDEASFIVDDETGQIRTSAVIDYEVKNSYTVTVNVTDSTNNSDSITVTINVTDETETPISPALNLRTPVVRAAIVDEALGVSNVADVTVAHLAAITKLNLNAKSLTLVQSTDFNGLTGLTSIDLGSNSLTSVSALSGLTQLTSLRLNNNSLTDISALSGLTQLTELDLSSNSLSNISALSGMTNLTYLNLSSNSIIDISALSGMTSMDTIDLRNTSITNVAAMSSMTSLSYVYIAGTSISDYAPLRTLKTANPNLVIDININNNPPAFTDGTSTTRSVAENTKSGENIGSAVAATDADNDTLTYTLGGTDAASFSIHSTTGQLQTKAALDYETKSSYSVTITASDGNGGTDSINVVISVTDVDETSTNNEPVSNADNSAPVFAEGNSTTRSVAENTGSGVDIGTAVSATDPDNDTLTYSLGGTDAASFSINSTNGQLRTNAALDYETQTSYAVTLTVSDSNGGSDTITVTINVTDVNENLISPSISSRTPQVRNAIVSAAGVQSADDVTVTHLKAILSLNLNEQSIRSLKAGDFNGLTALKTLNLSNNSISDISTLSGLTQLTHLDLSRNSMLSGMTAITTLSLDYNLIFDISALSGMTKMISLNLRSNNVGDISALSGMTLMETLDLWSNKITDVSALSGMSLLFHLTLAWNPISDFAPLRTLKAANPSLSIDINLNNNSPVFTEGSSTTRSIPERTASGTNIGNPVAATDADNHTLNYSLSGTDANSFSIIPDTGQLQTFAALDYETKTTYTVTITVFDDNNGGDKITVTINVTDVSESAPVFTDGTSTTRSVAENSALGTNVGTPVAATDADNDTLTYTISGTDAASFSIDDSSGQIRTIAALDYEVKNSYTVTVNVTDSTNSSDSITVTINVTDEDESTISPALNLRTPAVRDAIVDEARGVSNVADVTVAHLAAITKLNLNAKSLTLVKSTDFNGLTGLTGLDLGSNSLTSLSSLSGLTNLTELSLSSNSLTNISALSGLTNLTELNLSNNSLANISALSGLTKLTDLNLNNNSITDISALSGMTSMDTLDLRNNNITNVSALSGMTSLSYVYIANNSISDYAPLRTLMAANPSLVIDIKINNSAPTFTEGTRTTRSVAENTKSSQSIGSAVAATDADNDTLTYTLGGTDAASFGIFSTNGRLQTKAALDYEKKSSYDVTITVEDGNNGSDSIDVTINVTNVNDAPTFTEGISTIRFIAADAASGVNIGDPVAATDQDTADTLAYTLGGTDAASFSIVSTSGQLQTKVALDENTETYSVTVSVSDGKGGSDSITVTIEIGTGITPVKDRTTQVRDAIVAAVTGVTNADDVTEAHLAAITELNLASKSITALQARDFTGLTGIQTLYLNHTSGNANEKNSISDISMLEGLTTLTSLNLSDNQISDISVLSGMASMTELSLSNNSISDISALSGMASMTSLSMTNNNVVDLSPLSGMTSLSSLSVAGNPISDYATIRTLQSHALATLDIGLSNNPPTFTDGATTTRIVYENTAAGEDIGEPVAATDTDNHTLSYSLGGTDADSFSIVSTSGQIQTKAALHFPTKSTYTVTVTAYDGNNGGDRITVTIRVRAALSSAPSLEESSVIPENTALLSNYPNPFNPETWIPFQLAKPSEVTLTIYDIRGRVVRTLILGNQPAGVYQSRSKAAHWDGRNHFGEKVATGVYFYTLKAGDWTATRKMLIRK